MNPKIARDPYLRPLCERHGEAAVFEAGFFLDDDPDDAPLDDVDWLCTPTARLRQHLAAGTVPGGPDPDTAPGTADGPPVVLLSTGGFFPVHAGHLAMMATARQVAEGEGLRVVGGYLSPGHDDYLTLKCGSLPLPASARLALAAEAVADSDWLEIDPWEALARRVAVNFTDVAARLERYLQARVDPALEVVYVCGGDNARFALAFAERGRCVVVGRPGHDPTVARWRTDPRLAGHPRIRWAEGDDDSASSALRPVRTDPPARRLHLRREDERAVATLGLPADAWRRFQEGLVARLRQHLDLAVPLPDGPTAGAGLGPDHRPTISLDPFTPGDVDLAVSRLFDLGGLRLLGHVARPGAPALEEQVAALRPGRWRVRDDDRATGSTAAFLRTLLPDHVAADTFTFRVEDAGAEIADSRDFLLGTDHGGLVVALPDGSIGRAPYLLPFVDPAVRAGIPGAEALPFSIDVWRLNAETLAGTGLSVADLPAASARPLLVAGERPDAPLHEVATRYADRLAGLLPPGRPDAGAGSPQAPASSSVE